MQMRPCGDNAVDIELLNAHIAGDVRAFGKLVARHGGHLWRTAVRRSPTVEDAEAALQEALFAAHRAAAHFRAATVCSWLHLMVTDACDDRSRRAAGAAPAQRP